MEPLHITEFASRRYYEKLDQLPKEPQQNDVEAQVEGSSAKTTIEFAAREGEGEGEARRPSIASVASASSIVESTAPKRSSLPFDQLFLNLPNELKIQVIASLPLSDVLNLRLASRAWHGMVTLNEVPIVRYQLDHQVPAYAKRLYPVPDASGYNLHYLCSLWHRLHVAAKLARRMCDWCTKEIFLKTTREQVASFAGQRERMYRRLIPLLFTIFHFFENYRRLHVQYIQEHGYGLSRTPYTTHPIETQIMNMYDDRTLLQVHQIFPMVVSSFSRRLRPPSYVGRLEKTIRGYLRDEPADEVKTAVLCLGGLRQVLRCWEVHGYNTRITSVETWYNSIHSAKEPPRPAETSSKDNANWQIRDAAKADDTARPNRGSLEQVNSRNSITGPSNMIFNTSLAAGMPMDQLDQDQFQRLLSDLPPLQKLWLFNAEVMILDRRIVERSVDIKRNAQVLIDLIKEHGVVEEDIWWYGMVDTESIRPPPLEAIEEDPIE
ncbi:hypothetical protein M406DRAFT_98309 [Cryphonectria parasitica EP155]|uniref:F-box domain-containing protein n=1 Tax=Cryphonectria parasitica (strain ATCC 38755 / EP155) TaxID=660469 RepID=A0A9P5CP83_CRYP1|nr:uncharacterized protein M406DRAFT_98309 [Cryphonectria parasitica EP155]KAF3764901.1 hypothetical protein M406DRAFT_98309 [Cryphonectria parasitica EP155]